MTVRPVLRAMVLAGLWACAETTAPLPPPDELLLVVNTGEASLSVVRISDGPAPVVITLGAAVPADARPAAGRELAVVAAGNGDSLAVVNLKVRTLVRTIALGPGAGALGAVVVGDSIAYVALAGRDRLARVNLVTGDTLTAPAGHTPKDVTLARGRLFVVNANLAPCPPPDNLCPAGEPWLSVVDPLSLSRAGGRDSIPIPGPGNASYLVGAADGRLYVLSTGGPEAPAGRLSIVDPLTRSELGSFGGFGDRPGSIASDRTERIMVSSRSEGLMVFNTRTRSVERGAGAGIPLQVNAGVAADSKSLIYGVEAGPCNGLGGGRVRVFRPDLTEVRTIGLGRCPAAAVTALIPRAEEAALR